MAVLNRFNDRGKFHFRAGKVGGVHHVFFSLSNLIAGSGSAFHDFYSQSWKSL